MFGKLLALLLGANKNPEEVDELSSPKQQFYMYDLEWSQLKTSRHLDLIDAMLQQKGYSKEPIEYPTDTLELHVWHKDENTIALQGLRDETWLLDLFMNDQRQPVLVMNKARLGEPDQGVPESIKRDFKGHFTAKEGRKYYANLQNLVRWLDKNT